MSVSTFAISNGAAIPFTTVNWFTGAAVLGTSPAAASTGTIGLGGGSTSSVKYSFGLVTLTPEEGATFPPPISFLTSVKCPVIAAAAAIAGLTK
ncbi:hypothetical protein BN14_01542 [Rhizoctonia solani AG-1 IB]|uniref:Uncharacterized protein n=1 Tax=Thanatephorus cucumeris (strain AG1-IB / isolate 7/3/14) TaxID=1108050 RepID=M5BL93_THACB|nr:hypothetical protein BN14_01542 [Rhizoctonia solani AG-1 IB]